MAKRLQDHGAKIIDCDKVGHDVYKPHKPCYNNLIKAFGEKILSPDGEVNRKVLGSIVFSDPVNTNHHFETHNKYLFVLLGTIGKIKLNSVALHR